MTERAAHLVDDILPPVPVRQWVLTLPYRLRYLLAWDHGLTRAVLAVQARALLAVRSQPDRHKGPYRSGTPHARAPRRHSGGNAPHGASGRIYTNGHIS